MEVNQDAGTSVNDQAITDQFFKTSTEELEQPTEDEAIESTEADSAETVSEEELNNDDSLEGDESAEDSDDEDNTESYFVDLDEQEDVLVSLKGKEYTKQTLEEAIASGMKEKDYRQKTQRLAEERRLTTEERQQVHATAKALNDSYVELKAIVEEWEPEKAKEFESKLSDSLKTTAIDYNKRLSENLSKFASTNPRWVKGDKTTPEFGEVTKRMQNYMQDRKFSEDSVRNLTPELLEAVEKASRFDSLQERNELLKKKAKKLPVVTKAKPKSVPKKPSRPSDTIFGKSLQDSKQNL